MDILLSLAVVVLTLAVFCIAVRRPRAPAPEERQDDLPSLHSVVSTFPRHGRADSTEDTAPSILPRRPEWDTKS
jgi:hypothetical protein